MLFKVVCASLLGASVCVCVCVYVHASVCERRREQREEEISGRLSLKHVFYLIFKETSCIVLFDTGVTFLNFLFLSVLVSQDRSFCSDKRRADTASEAES